MNINQMVRESLVEESPISYLDEFIEKHYTLHENTITKDNSRFVGYLLDIGFENAKVVTTDAYKHAVGGISLGDFLIVVLDERDASGKRISYKLPPHFILLRVGSVAPTPLNQQNQQIYFELHKRSMPTLDVFTRSELEWGALDCDVLGMYFQSTQKPSSVAFSGIVNNVFSPHRYKVFSPDNRLLDLILNGLNKKEDNQIIGQFKPTECSLFDGYISHPNVMINIRDLLAKRTAMFGKTTLGKSNTVKILADTCIRSNKYKIGQLIYDINGEYANNNSHTGQKSLASIHPAECIVYGIAERNKTVKELKINFAELPDVGIKILKDFLEKDSKTSNYIMSFANVKMPSIDEVNGMTNFGEKIKNIRKIQMYWAILKKAGFEMDETRLLKFGLNTKSAKGINPGFTDKLREAIHGKDINLLPPVNTLSKLVNELSLLADFISNKSSSPLLLDKSKEPLFDAEAKALLSFLNHKTGTGPGLLSGYKIFHSPNAGHITEEIISFLKKGKTVILDLALTNNTIRKYFADLLSYAVFKEQEKAFRINREDDNELFIQLYFEEAHNVFPPGNSDNTTIYHRIAKEGAKFNIGMVYSTQSPSTISKELLVQTENFFVGHISSGDEIRTLGKIQWTFDGFENIITKSHTPGYMLMLTASNRFAIPVQIKKFE